jgi:hypothetical protein
MSLFVYHQQQRTQGGDESAARREQAMALYG